MTTQVVSYKALTEELEMQWVTIGYKDQVDATVPPFGGGEVGAGERSKLVATWMKMWSELVRTTSPIPLSCVRPPTTGRGSQHVSSHGSTSEVERMNQDRWKTVVQTHERREALCDWLSSRKCTLPRERRRRKKKCQWKIGTFGVLAVQIDEKVAQKGVKG